MKFNPQRRRLVGGAAAGSMLGALPMGAFAQAEAIPIAEFFRVPAMSQVRLSPDAKSVLGTRVLNRRINLFVYDVESRRSRTITNFADADVVSPRWVSNDRILFGTLDRSRGSGDQVGTGLFAIDKDANDYRELSERGFLSENSRLLPQASFAYGKGVGSGPDELLVSVYSTGGSRTLNSSNIYRLNTRTGRSSLLTAGGPGRVLSWVFDSKGVPRVAVSGDDAAVTRVHYRASADGPWQVIAEYRFDSPSVFMPLAFDEAGHLLLLTRVNSDFLSVHRFNVQTQKIDPEPLAAIKGYDIEADAPADAPAAPGDPLIQGDNGRLLGIRYHAERRGVYWLDEARANLQASLDATFPDRTVSFQGDPSKTDRPLLLTLSSDTQAPAFMLYTPARKALEPIGSALPWLKPEQMSTMQTMRYDARDGLSIPATLTLPRGKEKTRLPLIVLHYGGPWVRASQWGFDRTVQFLASRGYAVFMPAPRASTGYGWKHFRAGWKQWGLAMQDDVTDGVQFLIKQGTVDPKRVCIAGASYGGYLAMMGLAKDPGLYRCGINWVGVTDPELMYIEWTDFAAGNGRETSLPLTLGHPKTDAEQFARTSPVKRAAEIKQPVLMAYGGSDRRVPLINGERMRDALRGHNPNVEYVVYPDEGHGFQREESLLDFWGRVERFLAKHMV